MFMWKRVLIINCVSLLLSSCGDRKSTYSVPAFPVVKELHGDRLSDELIIGYPYDMFVNDKFVFILALLDDHWLQVYDKETGKHIGGFITQGQGPGEVAVAQTVFYDEQHQRLSVFDQTSMKLLFYHLNDDVKKMVSFESERLLHDLGGGVRHAWPLSEKLLLVDGQLGKEADKQKRFQLLSGDQVIAEYNDFPVNLPEERLTFLNPAISVSPDRKKMAVGTLYGGILESFDLADSIIQKNVKKLYRPIVEMRSGAIRNTDETVFGFSSLCATKEYIYSVLIGNKNPNLFNNISVFDWDGCEVIKYTTDCLVFKICASSTEPNKLYGIAFSENKEFYIVSFTLL